MVKKIVDKFLSGGKVENLWFMGITMSPDFLPSTDKAVLRIELVTAWWEARTLPLCYAVLPNTSLKERPNLRPLAPAFFDHSRNIPSGRRSSAIKSFLYDFLSSCWKFVNIFPIIKMKFLMDVLQKKVLI